MKIAIDKIKVSAESYPRESLDSETVNNYRLNLEHLPPIVLTKDLILVDGYHRLTAHKIANVSEIDVDEALLDIPESEIFAEAVRRNAFHGRPLSINEKRKAARRLFDNSHEEESAIALMLGVGKSQIYEWTKDIRTQRKNERDQQILDLYLACYTQEEIAEKVKISQKAVSNIIVDSKNSIGGKITTPDSLQYYNVWNFGQCDERYGIKGFPGRIPGQIIENLLYYYTEPFDLVVDPMTGSGTAIDVCKAFYRRYLAYDIKPVRQDIKPHDIRQGFPEKAKGCQLIFLDPPYWRLKNTEYAEESISAGSYTDWLVFISELASLCHNTLKAGAFVAFLIEPFFDRETEKHFVDLAIDSYNLFIKHNLVEVQRISVPLPVSTISINDQKYGTSNHILLDLNRDLLVFQKR